MLAISIKRRGLNSLHSLSSVIFFPLPFLLFVLSPPFYFFFFYLWQTDTIISGSWWCSHRNSLDLMISLQVAAVILLCSNYNKIFIDTLYLNLQTFFFYAFGLV